MAKHRLTDRHVRNAKPQTAPYRLFDGDGLALWVSPSGARSWQFRYVYDSKAQTATLGKADRMTLAEARDAADRARKLAAAGEHLTSVKRVEKAQRRADTAATFASVAVDWLKIAAREADWTDDYRDEVAASIRNHLVGLNGLPIAAITAKVAAPLLRKVDRRAPDMARKVRQRLRAILDHAVEQGLIHGNPLPTARRRKAGERKHYAAVTDLPGIGEILRAARASDPCKGIQRAHVLLAFTAQRVSEVVGATWDEFGLRGVNVPIDDGHRSRVDPAAGNWSIPRERMKRKDHARGPHIVPLPPALLAALREWRRADGDAAVYVCPAPRDKQRSITRESVEKFYRRSLGLAGKHGPHSWRSAFSTVSREAGKDADAIEAQLDHVVGSKIAAAYDRARRLELRRALVTWYEATLLTARDGAAVTSLIGRQRRKS